MRDPANISRCDASGGRNARNSVPVLLIIGLACCGCLLVSCGSYHAAFTPDDPYWKDNDTKDIAEPKKRNPSLAWETVERSTFQQVEQILDLDRSFRKIGGRPRQALNINSVDEVPNSSWFTNRHHLNRMTPAQIKRGVEISGGPDKSGPWTVFRPKVGGVTAGFWIKDPKGREYILKFDPVGNPQMATAAAVMAGRFFHACGYNVPEETITSFRPEDLLIGEGVTYQDSDGNKQPFTREKLNRILALAEANSDGSIRCLASLALPDIKGPFSFDGRRKDDANDWCRHEHRRELRALYVFCSFINHWDIKDLNTMDTYTRQDGRGYLRHHLLDFGSTFGSSGRGPQHIRAGYSNLLDLRDAFVSLVTIALKKWQWEDARPYQYPSKGYFESDIFHAAKWDPIYPIPAFENMTDRDAYWGAKIVMSFRDDDLRALIDAGQLSNPEAREYLFNTLVERRDKIGRHWFSKVNPLDCFELVSTDEGLQLIFEDLALNYGLSLTARSRYDIRYRGREVIEAQPLDASPLTFLPEDVHTLADRYQAGDKPENNLFEIRIKTQRDGGGWSKPVAVWLWYYAEESRWHLVGVEHPD